MRGILFFLLCCVSSNGFSQTPSEALKQLLEGHRRFFHDELLHHNHASDRREALSKQQNPFAAIVCCSDSRVAPEIIFDQGLGDLFVVRVAGNVVGPLELDSIEYATKYLGSSVVFVLGHEFCGAVTAVLQGKTTDIEDVARLIAPAIKGAKTVEEAIKDNVRSIVAYLKTTPVLQQLLKEKKIECIGAYYHLTTGNIEILQP